MKKIAFLFLIYDEINQEELWYNFFNKIDKNKYSIYVHYKHNRVLKYFESYKLEKIIPTEYADMSLVKAQNLLLKEALKNQDNERFVFLSNSCIPLKKFSYIYEKLHESALCHFNMARNEHIIERGRGQQILKNFGRKNVKKASQWCILTRGVAEILSESDSVLESLFVSGQKDLADEYFHISYLYYLNMQSSINETCYEAEKSTTFEYWNDKDYGFNDDFTSTHPAQWDRRLKTFYDISENELFHLVHAPCLFGRKFDVNCTVNGLLKLSDKLISIYNE